MPLTTYSEGANAYQQAAVTTASPLDLVVMLYDAALANIHRAKDAMASGDRFKQNAHLTKAQRIVTELLCALDHDSGGDIAQNLAALYTFAHGRLVEGNMQDDATAVDEAERVIADLRLCWSDLRSMVATEKAA
ncbi:MAG: flagellar export chaperone FliS [Fimbriimonadaceae bacterium]|nr:flagellar export chaperone FliS [Fimbriimonadaceae bacterium]